MNIPIQSFLNEIEQTDLAQVHPVFRRTAPVALFQFPWDIAKQGAAYMGQISGARDALVGAGKATMNSSAGPGLLNSIAGSPTNPANTDPVVKNGYFTDALDSIKSDNLLRSVYIGWAGGTQVGIFGGSGGGGVAYDIVDESQRCPVSYGVGQVGIGAQAITGFLVGALTRQPGQIDESICAFQFGAMIVGVGVFITVLMTYSSLDLIGFTAVLGVGGGLSTSTGYGSIYS